MVTVLVTGAAGFVGGHLLDHLLAAGGVRVVGLTRGPPPAAPGVEWRRCDLLDPTAVAAVVREVRPDRVAHLAGFASPRESKKQAVECWAGNLTATRTLYAALAAAGLRPRVLLASTAQVYGEPAGRVTENTPFRPTTPYAASKAEIDRQSGDPARTHGLAVVRARLFNAFGPRQQRGYAVPDWASQIVAAERRGEPLALAPAGSLDVRRDLTDVRDVAAALRLLLEKGTPGEAYNVASGWSHVLADVLDRLIARARVPVTVRREAGPAAELAVDGGKLFAATGWRPVQDFDQSLADTLDDWRAK